jgi:hypothetical protein
MARGLQRVAQHVEAVAVGAAAGMDAFGREVAQRVPREHVVASRKKSTYDAPCRCAASLNRRRARRTRALIHHDHGETKSGARPMFATPSHTTVGALRASSAVSACASAASCGMLRRRRMSLPPATITATSKPLPGPAARTCARTSASIAPLWARLSTCAPGNFVANRPASACRGPSAPRPSAALSPTSRSRIESHEPGAPIRPSPPSRASMSIVIADDNVSAVNLLAELLRMEGHRVDIAPTARRRWRWRTPSILRSSSWTSARPS